MKLPSEVPWVEKEPVVVDGKGKVQLPRVDMRDASEEWIGAVAVALGAEVEDEDAEGDVVESEDVVEDTLASI